MSEGARECDQNRNVLFQYSQLNCDYLDINNPKDIFAYSIQHNYYHFPFNKF